MVLPDVHVAAPALNGAAGPPEIAAEVAFPELEMVTDVAADVCPTESDPKFIDAGATERIGAPGASTFIVTTALVAVTPLSSLDVAKIE